MGIDLKKMRAKMDALENKGGKNIFWRPEDGETTIRLVPTADGDPFKEYWFHYNVGLVLNPDYGDITDTAEGTDLVINYGKPVGAQFPQTSITPRRKTSALSDDENQVHAWLDSIPNFEEVFERKTPQEVRTMLDEFLLSQDDAEEVSSESSRYESTDSNTDRAFKELLNG
jgi:hypothetical protein